MKQRLLSVDVLRGLTIFFMIIVNSPGTWQFVYAPLRHAEWDGCTPTDLVFPFFVFIMGVSSYLSFSKYSADRRSQLRSKILKRTLLIFLVGLLLNWYPFFNKSIVDLRIFGVLQRIALAYGLGSLMIIYLKRSQLLVVFPVILLGYWLILLAGGGATPLSLEDNLVRKLDLILLGENHLYHGYGIPFDPEGLLSTLPSAGTMLLGYLAASKIFTMERHLEKVKWLGAAGIICVILGIIWNFAGFPINKPIWSSSYVLFSGGLGMLVLVLLIYLIDDRNFRSWSFTFEVFGRNPLISYVLSGLILKTMFLMKINGQNVYAWLYTEFFQKFLGDYLGSFTQALSYTFLIWLFAWYLYRQNKIIKL